MYSSKMAKYLVAAALVSFAPAVVLADSTTMTTTKQVSSGEHEELTRLREENRRLKEENERLKAQLERQRSGGQRQGAPRQGQKPATPSTSTTSTTTTTNQ